MNDPQLSLMSLFDRFAVEEIHEQRTRLTEAQINMILPEPVGTVHVRKARKPRRQPQNVADSTPF